jgi:oligoendopeptidase F
LLGLEKLDVVYDEDDAKQAYVAHMNDVLDTFTWVATIDAFQHWIYTHEGHSPEERVQAWTELRTRFAPWIDWSGLEEYRDHEWQRQGHLFGSAFYYIEYAIAQIGALQVWRNERQDHEAAVAAYRKALALGGSRPPPELFEAANLRFAMDKSILQEPHPRRHGAALGPRRRLSDAAVRLQSVALNGTGSPGALASASDLDKASDSECTAAAALHEPN